MSKIKTTSNLKTSAVKPAQVNHLFGKENYKWMLIGLVVLVIGFFLMAGGKSEDPTKFNADEVYSFTRITLAPLLLIIGFAIEIYAIMIKSKDVEL